MELNQLKTQINIWMTNEWARNLFILFIIYIFLSVTSRFLKKSINRKFSDNNVKLKLRSTVGIVLTLIFVLSGLFLFSSKISGLTVALGVAGAGIAFALQEVIASVAGWFAIQFGGFYVVGDRINIGGTKGDVIDIGVLRTTVMELGQWVKGDQYNGRVVRVANSFVFKEPVVNYSADFPFLWDEITVPVKYGSNIQKTRHLFKNIADKYFDAYEERAKKEWVRLVDKYVIENAKVDNQIYLTADENWLTFTIRYVTDYKSRRLVKDHLFTEIISAIEENSSFVSIAGASIEITSSDNLMSAISQKHSQGAL
ncbi:MAG: mechanosensitive ion channel family protein [Bdellovibrionales bacterium]